MNICPFVPEATLSGFGSAMNKTTISTEMDIKILRKY